MARWIYLIVTAVVLVGCSYTFPLRGKIQDSDETFTGLRTINLSGASTFEIVSNKNVTCEGDFVGLDYKTFKGIMSCSDGRTGIFYFYNLDKRDDSYGELDGKKITIKLSK